MNNTLELIDKVTSFGKYLTDNYERPPDLTINLYFLPGVYVRSGLIPAGYALTGKVHNYECINIVAKGRIAIATQDGHKILEAGAIFKTPAGTKKAGYAIEDTVFITIHNCDLTEIDEVERHLTSDTYEEYTRRLTCL
jgi:hypothetical protein